MQAEGTIGKRRQSNVLRLISISILMLFSVSVFSQEKKGDKLTEQHLYQEAIKAYEKALEKASSTDLNQKVGRLYVKTKQFEKAKIALYSVVDDPSADPVKYKDYAFVMLSMNDWKEATRFFQLYADNEKNDPNSDLYLESCKNISKWKEEDPAWKISTVSGINTEKSEFSPYPYLNGLFYVSNGKSDWVDYGGEGVMGQNYFDIYYAKQSSNALNFEEGDLFSKAMSSEYHDGPIAVTPKKDAIYFNRLDRNGKSERMHLYYAEIKEGKIQKIEAFNYNNDEYSIMHPTFSEDGKIMYFASDKAGGVGGFDIYMCKKSRRYGWSAPRPVSGLVNTLGNELFPHVRDGQLFFSSDGHFGYGGMDMFVAFESEQYKVVTNLKAPLNSAKDDFGFFAIDDKFGYISSDREGGKGLDDIYYFEHLEKIKVDEFPTMTGTFLFKELETANVELILLDENGVEIARVKTDERGRFEFRNLDPNGNYSIQPLGDEYGDGDIYITNASGEKLTLMQRGEDKAFKFKPLKSGEATRLKPIEEDYPTFLTLPVSGFIYKELEGDLGARIEVLIYDEDGVLLGRTYTDENGKFIFKNLIPDASYVIKVATDDDIQMTLFDRRGKEYEDVTKQENGSFKFVRLDPDVSTFKLLNEENVILEIRQKEKFALPSIYYASNSAEINAASAEQLDKLYILLRKNLHVIVTFESHTDSKGKDSYNMRLSEKRSDAAVKYLLKKGAAKSQVIAVGYGETKLLNKCKNDVNCTDEEHALNRRTEISLSGKKIRF